MTYLAFTDYSFGLCKQLQYLIHRLWRIWDMLRMMYLAFSIIYLVCVKSKYRKRVQKCLARNLLTV